MKTAQKKAKAKGFDSPSSSNNKNTYTHMKNTGAFNNVKQPDFKKHKSVPVIVQDNITSKVLVFGHMNEEAYIKSKAEGKVYFYNNDSEKVSVSGSKESTFLHIVKMLNDADGSTLLVKVNPGGPTCENGADTCWGEDNSADIMFFKHLQDFLEERKTKMPEGSYTTKLFKKGINKISQKVGEEAVEMIIDATNGTDKNMIYEGADLMYHLIVLLIYKGYRLEDLARELKKRHK